MTDPRDPLRTCKHCGHDWPLTEYKRDGDGYLGHRCRECRQSIDRKASRAYLEAHRDQERARWRRIAETPKAKAREMVRKAVESGQLVRPDSCDACWTVGLVQGHHHNGYERPLDVQWLCRRCHSRLHREEAVRV